MSILFASVIFGISVGMITYLLTSRSRYIDQLKKRCEDEGRVYQVTISTDPARCKTERIPGKYELRLGPRPSICDEPTDTIEDCGDT